MSELTITADEFSAYAANLRRENLKNQLILSAMKRMASLTGEMDEEELGYFACEIETLLEVLHDRLVAFAGEISYLENVKRVKHDA